MGHPVYISGSKKVESEFEGWFARFAKQMGVDCRRPRAALMIPNWRH